MQKGFIKLITLLLVPAIVAAFSTSASADAVLTAAASSAGYHLSTFIDGFQNDGIVGPLSAAFNGDGSVIVTEYQVGNVAIFASGSDGQHASGAAHTVSYGGHNPTGLVKLGFHTYMTLQNSGEVVEIDNAGNLIRVVAHITNATGITADPLTGHLLVTNVNSAILDVNPITGAVDTFMPGIAPDGITFTPDGLTLFVAASDQSVLGFHRGSAIPFFTSSVAGADGLVLGSGSLAGDIFVNSNFGTLVQVNIASGSQTVLMTGGTRGDFVSVDPGGSLAISQTDRLLRLTAPDGSGFGASAPLPASASSAFCLLAILGIVCAIQRLASSSRRLPNWRTS